VRIERGQAIVEFALAATLVIALFFGIVEFGRALYAYDQVGHAARYGTRYAIVNTPAPPNDCSTSYSSGGTCQQAIYNYVLSEGNLDPSNLSATILFGPTTSTCTTTPTTSNGCWVRIDLSETFQFLFLPINAITLHSSSQVYLSAQAPTPGYTAPPPPSPTPNPSSSPGGGGSPSPSPSAAPSAVPSISHCNKGGRHCS